MKLDTLKFFRDIFSKRIRQDPGKFNFISLKDPGRFQFISLN